MAGHPIHHFQNDAGHPTINVGVSKFMCVGANPPFDHPHEYLDMGDANEIICPYCSTLYKHDVTLDSAQTNPDGCIYSATVS